MSELTVGQLKGLPVNSNKITVPSGHTLYAPGHTVQTVQTVNYTATALNSGNFCPYNGLDTTVIPKFSNSKFLIRYQINVGTYTGSSRIVLKINGSYYNTIYTNEFRSSSQSTYFSSGLPNEAFISGYTGEYLFQNTGTSNVLVSFEVFRQDSAYVVYVNRAYSYNDSSRGNPTSWVTIQEIAQ